MSKRLSLSDQLRRAIDRAPMSRYRICKEVGLDASTMSRLMNRNGGLSFEMLDRIGELLDLRLMAGKSKPAKGT